MRSSKWILSSTQVPSTPDPGLDRDTLTGGGTAHYPSSLWEPNPTYGLQFGLAVCPLTPRKGIHNGRAGVNDTTFHTYAYAALCRIPPWVGVAPGHSRNFPTYNPRTYRGRMSLSRCPICMFFSLLESFLFIFPTIYGTPHSNIG